MQVMIVEDDPVRCRALAAVLRGQGLDVLAFTEIAPAKEAARRSILDLLVLGERVGGRLTHDLALLAEWRNPGLGLVLLSDREGEGREELFDLLPALRAVLPCRAGAAEVAQATLAVARSQSLGTTPVLPHWRSLQRPEPVRRSPPRVTPPAERAAPLPAAPTDHARLNPSRQAEHATPLAAAPSRPPPPAAADRSGQLPSFLHRAAPAPASAAQRPTPGHAIPARSTSPPRRLHLA